MVPSRRLAQRRFPGPALDANCAGFLRLGPGLVAALTSGMTDCSPSARLPMKIDAVELTLFAWDDIPPTKYTQGSQNTSGHSNLGPAAHQDRCRHRGPRVPRLRHQPGRDRRRRADPLPQADPDGQGPAGARGPARRHARAPAHHGPAHHRRLRHRAVGHRRQGRRHAALQVARRRPLRHRRLCLEPDPRQPRGLRRRGGAVQGRRLEGLQDPSAADPPARTSRCARRCARRSATTTR